MSIRLTKFNNELLPSWNLIASSVKDINIKGFSSEERDELARLRKVTAYFSEMLESIDADLIPLQSIDNSLNFILNIENNLNSFSSYKDISYIRTINNNYLDSLLKELMPYVFYKGTASKALQNALTEYSEAIREHTAGYLAEIEKYALESQETNNKITLLLSELSEKEENIENYRDSLFNNDGLRDKIESLFRKSSENFEEMEDFHNQIFTSNGLKEQLEEYIEDAEEQHDSINELRKNSFNMLEELNNFYRKIFGQKNDNGEMIGGLEQELKLRKEQLDKFKSEQEQRYKELNQQIENLLPGATSAGLSTAYREMRETFSQSAKWYGKVFYFALLALLGSVVISHCFVSWGVFHFVDTPSENSNSIGINLLSLFRNLIFRSSFILPALWLVFFVSKRRNEAQRLEQEYAHKESLAKSYDSYKQQIEKLQQEERDKLLPILMSNMIKAIALNPAETLDKNHQDGTPLSELLKDKGVMEKVKELILKDKS